METNNNKEMQLQCQQLGPTLLFDKLMELQDLWTGHIKSICKEYAKSSDDVYKFLTALKDFGDYPFGFYVRDAFTRHDSTFINMTCKISEYEGSQVYLYIDHCGHSIIATVKMKYLLHQDKPALVKKLWTEYLQNFLKQTEEETINIKADYDSKMLAITRLKVELENLKNQ